MMRSDNKLNRYQARKCSYLIKQSAAVELRSVNDLVDCGYRFVSDDYREFVRSLERRRES